MKNYSAQQVSGMKMCFDCQAKSLEEAKEYFSQKSSIPCNVWEDKDQTKWISTNGYEGKFI